MTELIFNLNEEKDIRNVWELCNFGLPWEEPVEKKILNEEYKSLWRGRAFEDCKEEIWKSIEPLYSSGIIEAFRNVLETSWEGISEEYFRRLEKITKRPTPSSGFVAYATSAGRCPYDIENNSFMVSIKRPLLHCLRTSGHELMHLQFANYFWEGIERQIGKKQTANLSEGLTELLNSEFRDLWFVADVGYPAHQKLRKFIYDEWKKEKNFGVILDKCINYLKI